MSLTATIIAFAAGLAAKVRPARDAGLEKALATCKKLLAERRDAERASAYLLDRIEGLERELATERSLKGHWRDEARRLAAEARLRREAQERRQYQVQMNAAMAQQQAMQALGLGQSPAMQPDWPLYQQQLGMQGLLGAQNLKMPEGRTCTCIPDRASVLKGR
jgi:hypothetical protein